MGILNWKKLRNLLAGAVYWGIDSLILLAASASKADGRNGGACVMKLGGVGDFILWQSCLDMYSEAGDGGFLTLIVSKECADFARNLKQVNSVIPVDVEKFYKNIVYRAVLIFKIRAINYRIFINPTTSRKFPLTESISRLVRADSKVGVSSDLSNIEPLYRYISDGFYDRIVSLPGENLREIENNVLFCAGFLGLSYKAALEKVKKFYVNDLKNIVGERYFLIVPGASWSKRKWPAKYFASISAKIQKETGLIPVICGTQSDIADGTHIAAECGPRAVDLCGKTGASDLLSLIWHAEFVIGNESAGVHIAAFMGKKSIAILGGGHYGRFLPYPDLPETSGIVSPVSVYTEMDCFGCNWRCKFRTGKADPVPCIAGVSESEVYAAWRGLEIP